jgi:hypothetical protein
MKVRKPGTFVKELIDMWCFQPGIPMTGHVPVALIIGHDEDDMGLGLNCFFSAAG